MKGAALIPIQKSVLLSFANEKNVDASIARKKDALIADISAVSKQLFPLSGKFKKSQGLKKFSELITKYQSTVGLAGIILHDKNGRQVAANPVAKQLYNGSKNNAKFKTIDYLWTTEGVFRNEQGEPLLLENSPFIKALRTGKSQKELFNIRVKNGKQRWLFIHSHPFRQEGETEASYVISSIIDITHERNIAASQQERKDPVHSFMKENPNPAWVVNEEGDLVFANAAFFMHFGLKEENSVGRNLAELLPSGICEALHTKHLKAVKINKTLKTTEQIKLACGTQVISCINLFIIKGRGQKKMIAGQAVCLDDITFTETKLRATGEELLILNRAVSDAIWEWDMKAGYIYRNKALLNILGYKINSFTGIAWWLRHIHPDDVERVKENVKATTNKQLPSWQEQYRFRCADNSYKYIQDRGYIIYENNLPVRMIGSITDVSDIKKLETELAEERMRQQMELSETVLRVQEMERTRIGHELHDNINQILSCARLFLDTLNPGDTREQQSKNKSSQYISLAIEEIRKLSKELVTPQLKEEGLAENIRMLIDDIHLADPIRFEFEHDPAIESLSPNKKIALFRIVQEQIKNILKHSDAKTAGIAIGVNNRHIVLEMWDNGKGFMPGQNYQGIGLSNMRERVLIYNGSLNINTAPGKGCRLTVILPL